MYQLLIDRRAASILYRFLCSINTQKTWLLPANICPVVPCVFTLAKQQFQFIDIDPKKLCLNINQIYKKIIINQKNIAGFLFNYTYGCELFDYYKPKFAFLKEKFRGIYIIEDRCLCPPSLLKSIDNNNIADLILYSTGEKKYVDLGIGGFAFMKNELKYNSKINSFFNPLDYQQLEKWWTTALLKNEKTDYPHEKNWQWLDLGTFPKNKELYSEEMIKNAIFMKNYKQKINQIYEKNLCKKIQLSKSYQNWRFNILVDNKQELLQQLFENRLFASSHYHSTNALFNCNQNFIHSNNLHKKVINLFNDTYYTPKMAWQTVEIINNFLKKQ